MLVVKKIPGTCTRESRKRARIETPEETAEKLAAAKKKREEETAAKKKRDEEEEAAKLAAKKKREEETAAKKKRDEEKEAAKLAAKKKREEETASKKKREEKEAAKLAAAKKKREEETAAKKKRDEETAAKLVAAKKRDEEIAEKLACRRSSRLLSTSSAGRQLLLLVVELIAVRPFSGEDGGDEEGAVVVVVVVLTTSPSITMRRFCRRPRRLPLLKTNDHDYRVRERQRHAARALPLLLRFYKSGHVYSALLLSGWPLSGIRWGLCGNFALVHGIRPGEVADVSGVRRGAMIVGVDGAGLQMLDHSGVARAVRDKFGRGIDHVDNGIHPRRISFGRN
ncbi:hypothetical protein ACHAW5_000330 [Stephanodiscus triporus]|uniref:PDZ domain-containing protein n=1 Tax=Stephanodiscus triporus TaxID=2934178 RepID=A0ABD3PAB4_9STRA